MRVGGVTAGWNETIASGWVAPDYEEEGGEWEDVDVEAPDIRDRQTLISLAKMTSNAYVTPDSGEWWPVGDYNAVCSSGISRGHTLTTCRPSR
jgi:putative lipase involved disintegration of autophagic bodies